MSKKRKCRFTPEETALHREAIRLRKMSDKQLVEEFHRAAEPEMALTAPRVAQDGAEEQTPIGNTPAIEKLLSALSEGKCKGIGSGTVYKIATLAQEMGLI